METRETIIAAVENTSYEYKALKAAAKAGGKPSDRCSVWITGSATTIEGSDDLIEEAHINFLFESQSANTIWKWKYTFTDENLYRNQAINFAAQFFTHVAETLPTVKDYLDVKD